MFFNTDAANAYYLNQGIRRTTIDSKGVLSSVISGTCSGGRRAVRPQSASLWSGVSRRSGEGVNSHSDVKGRQSLASEGANQSREPKRDGGSVGNHWRVLACLQSLRMNWMANSNTCLNTAPKTTPGASWRPSKEEPHCHGSSDERGLGSNTNDSDGPHPPRVVHHPQRAHNEPERGRGLMDSSVGTKPEGGLPGGPRSGPHALSLSSSDANAPHVGCKGRFLSGFRYRGLPSGGSASGVVGANEDETRHRDPGDWTTTRTLSSPSSSSSSYVRPAVRSATSKTQTAATRSMSSAVGGRGLDRNGVEEVSDLRGARPPSVATPSSDPTIPSMWHSRASVRSLSMCLDYPDLHGEVRESLTDGSGLCKWSVQVVASVAPFWDSITRIRHRTGDNSDNFETVFTNLGDVFVVRTIECTPPDMFQTLSKKNTLFTRNHPNRSTEANFGLTPRPRFASYSSSHDLYHSLCNFLKDLVWDTFPVWAPEAVYYYDKGLNQYVLLTPQTVSLIGQDFRVAARGLSRSSASLRQISASSPLQHECHPSESTQQRPDKGLGRGSECVYDRRRSNIISLLTRKEELQGNALVMESDVVRSNGDVPVLHHSLQTSHSTPSAASREVPTERSSTHGQSCWKLQDYVPDLKRVDFQIGGRNGIPDESFVVGGSAVNENDSKFCVSDKKLAGSGAPRRSSETCKPNSASGVVTTGERYVDSSVASNGYLTGEGAVVGSTFIVGKTFKEGKGDTECGSPCAISPAQEQTPPSHYSAINSENTPHQPLGVSEPQHQPKKIPIPPSKPSPSRRLRTQMSIIPIHLKGSEWKALRTEVPRVVMDCLQKDIQNCLGPSSSDFVRSAQLQTSLTGLFIELRYEPPRDKSVPFLESIVRDTLLKERILRYDFPLLKKLCYNRDKFRDKVDTNVTPCGEDLAGAVVLNCDWASILQLDTDPIKFIRRPDEVPAPVEQSDEVPAPVEQSDEVPAPVEQSDEVPAPVEQSDEVPAPVEQSDEVPAPVEQSDEVPAPVEQSDEVPAPVEQSNVDVSVQANQISEKFPFSGQKNTLDLSMSFSHASTLPSQSQVDGFSRTGSRAENSSTSVSFLKLGFPGRYWRYALLDKHSEVDRLFKNEICDALSLPPGCIFDVHFYNGSLKVDFYVRHPVTLSYAELCVKLLKHSFKSLCNFYSNFKKDCLKRRVVGQLAV
ncbi:unnamed protein product [Phytomonas sp. EM1]|nr:unnamed protein product [Phytomonas sp. EM1]|eukprot:CCW65085.1 unnamed protein product [Phytomonas sp. isolate EM1]